MKSFIKLSSLVNSTITQMLILTFVFFFFISSSHAQVTTLWEKSQSNGNLPTFFGSNTERGFAYGYVGGNHRLYVVKNSPATVIILNATTGDSIGTLNVTGVTGGTFALNDIEVSDDGKIFGCNLTTSATTSAFKVYRWDSESAAPVLVINYTSAAYRLGDLMTVVGSASDNSLTIYAAQSGGANIVKFTTTDGGNTFTPSVITVSGFTNMGTLPKVYPTSSGFWTNGNGQNLRQLNASGALSGAVDLNIVPSNSSSIAYFSSGSKEYLVQYLYGPSTTITSSASFFERAFILDVTGGYSQVLNVGFTPFLGSNANSNGTGDVDVKNNGDGTFTVFVLSTNNGIGAYIVNPAGLSAVLTPPTLENFAQFWPPANWMRYTGFLGNPAVLTSTTLGWIPDDFGNVTTPVNRSARLNIYGTTRREWLVSPTINLGSGSTSYQLEYDLALTKYAATTPDTLGVDDTLAVLISTDNGVTWSTNNILSLYTSANFIPPNGMHEIISLQGYTGLVKIAFYGSSIVSNKDNDIFVDNFAINQLVTQPQLTVIPSSKDFGEVQINTTSAPQTFTLLNSGAGTLVISSVALTGANVSQFVLTDNNTYPVSLNQGQSITVQVAFAPTSASTKNANLTITHNAAGSPTDVPLTGTGVDFTITSFPYVQDWESTTFPPGGWLNVQVSGSGLFDRVTSGTNPTVTPKSGSAMVRYNSYNISSGNSAALISPPINFPHANFRLKFWMYRDNGYASNADRILIYFNNQPNLTGAVLIDSINRSRSLYPIVGADGWYQYSFMIPPDGAGNGKYIILRAISGYGNNMFLDSLAIEALPDIGWCNLQWPPNATITVGDSTWVFGQVWINGVTQDSGATPGLQAWVGISNQNTNPATWTNWVPANFNVQAGNNDEFMAYIGQGLAPGTYYYAFRYKYLQGDYKYGGYSSSGGGFWDGTNYVSGVLTVNPAIGPLSGDYYIPQGSHLKGFPTLADGFRALDTLGSSGPVRFLIDGDLNEVGASLVLNRSDLTNLKPLTIKPAPGKTPTITISGCTSATVPNQYTGITLNNASYVMIDGSNLESGNTRDLTIAMNDSLNGRIAIQLYGNTDYVSIKNTVIKFQTMNPALTTTRGIYLNGQASGVASYFMVENCKIGDDTYQPAYAVSVTGYSTGGAYADNIYISKNELYGHLRTLYFFYGGGFIEIKNNVIKGTVPPPTGNVRWGILFNNYNGTIQILNNKLQTLRMASAATNGIYGIGTLSAQPGTEMIIANNFLGGDFTHTGTGVPASVDVISLQDNIPTAKIYHNTIVLNDIGKLASSRMTAIRYGGTTSVEIKNNIIVNLVNANVAYGIYHSGGTVVSNNNAFYIPGTNANFAYYNGNIGSLQTWRNATGQDANSFVENPPFVGGLDFHIVPGSITNIESGGVWVGIANDIDNETRNSSTPDIGADEFEGFRPGAVPDTVNVAFRKYWNIVSIPVEATNMTKGGLFPMATSNAFWFNGQEYLVKDTLEVGKGYWLKFAADSSITVIGLKRDSLVIPVLSGWNLIGTLSIDIPTTNVYTNPAGILASNFFGFMNRYYPTNTLKKGEGYWIKTSSAGSLVLKKSVLAKDGVEEIYVETIEPNWRRIVISDAQGISQELYLADRVDEAKYSLPPLPPSSMFDVRFKTDRYVELDNYPQQIDLQGVKYPITLTITNAEKGFYRVKDGVSGTLLNVVLKNGQPITISDPTIKSLIIEGATIPTSFDLMQNYPNPFNPSTTIRYAISEPVRVKLIVYNAVGQKVKELVNADQEAGYYSVDFNASNLASGVYLIRLETPKYVKTIKALLIK
jgi:hypothetical protein